MIVTRCSIRSSLAFFQTAYFFILPENPPTRKESRWEGRAYVLPAFSSDLRKSGVAGRLLPLKLNGFRQ
ncbi:hypothetical protein BRO54_0384 [Geobacillus proteiniphilus]|uniref:Uncharacterized protein n=1 Tax=Geobacillus proteiniphilus TaxID=860353 RepID=A0A1Q5T9I4_9BACL|nr:hypothetical protein BRO54_0384 [Geobacillus proteiniphilus]